MVRAVYSTAFVTVWLLGVGSFYDYGLAYRSGSLQPTDTQTEALNNHGRIVYITPEQEGRLHLLELGAAVGIPSIIAAGFFLHFVLGVKIARKPGRW
jgi:hypothetical protein